MASTVHYKFKSQKDYDSVGFDGMFISVGDLKKSIVEKKGLARDQACELLLTNAQNDEEYTDDTTMVWKNTSVIVKRVPSMRAAAMSTFSVTVSPASERITSAGLRLPTRTS